MQPGGGCVQPGGGYASGMDRRVRPVVSPAENFRDRPRNGSDNTGFGNGSDNTGSGNGSDNTGFGNDGSYVDEYGNVWQGSGPEVRHTTGHAGPHSGATYAGPHSSATYVGHGTSNRTLYGGGGGGGGGRGDNDPCPTVSPPSSTTSLQPMTSDASHPLCECGFPSVLLTSRQEHSRDRRFYKCPNSKDSGEYS